MGCPGISGTCGAVRTDERWTGKRPPAAPKELGSIISIQVVWWVPTLPPPVRAGSDWFSSILHPLQLSSAASLQVGNRICWRILMLRDLLTSCSKVTSACGVFEFNLSTWIIPLNWWNCATCASRERTSLALTCQGLGSKLRPWTLKLSRSCRNCWITDHICLVVFKSLIMCQQTINNLLHSQLFGHGLLVELQTHGVENCADVHADVRDTAFALSVLPFANFFSGFQERRLRH